MTKISVQVSIPSVGKNHNFIIPDTMSVSKVIDLMVMTISDEYCIAKESANLSLIDLKDNKALHSGCSFAQLDINSGAKLILF